MSAKACVRGVVIAGDKVVLMHRHKQGEEYFTLPGGHIEQAESPEAALTRELYEELSVRVTDFDHILTVPESGQYGVQYVYLCRITDQDVELSTEADERLQNAQGSNRYEPGWYTWQQVAQLPLRSNLLKTALLTYSRNGWPDHVVELTS